jgi:hypothetical protein
MELHHAGASLGDEVGKAGSVGICASVGIIQQVLGDIQGDTPTCLPHHGWPPLGMGWSVWNRGLLDRRQGEANAIEGQSRKNMAARFQ